jgi:hypothetical protein
VEGFVETPSKCPKFIKLHHTTHCCIPHQAPGPTFTHADDGVHAAASALSEPEHDDRILQAAANIITKGRDL